MRFTACPTTMTAMMLGGALALSSATPSLAQDAIDDVTSCADLEDLFDPSSLHTVLKTALDDVVDGVFGPNNGLGNQMWATLVDRDGIVCAVAFSGEDRGDQWPGSRAISAQKANTANAFSLPEGSRLDGSGLALSTANLWNAAQPGGSTYVGNPPRNVLPGGNLFGLQFSNPVDAGVAYGASPEHGNGDGTDYGTPNDPMVGSFIGGVNVFGGGLALYDPDEDVLGGLGVSGDTSCTDHIIAWKLRDTLGLDFVPAGVAPGGTDNIIYDLVISPSPATGNTVSPSGFGHPECSPEATEIGESLPEICPIGATPCEQAEQPNG